jgi:NAD(P)-dependent dehydrogenase (short-subunit alcohol dehydrogenase family)
MSEELFAGQVVLITGGATGIGRAAALKFAKMGASVVITGRFKAPDENSLYDTGSVAGRQEVVETIEAGGGQCLAIKADITSFDEMSSAVQQTLDRFGRLDVVVANAGVFSGGVQAHELSEDEWKKMLDINVTGAWNTVRTAIPPMLDAGKGTIVFVGSLAGIKGGNPGFAHYTTAKHALVGLNRALATEYGPKNIRSNLVAPTSVVTPMSQNQFYYDLFSGGSGGTNDGAQEVIKTLHSLPVGAIEAEDVANAVVWLASEEARYIHGIVLPVDAGASMY